MKITTIGRGNVGGGLARLWRNAGHDVTELGKEGGDASDADAVLVAVPSGAIDDALASVSGLEGKVVIDATNAFAGRAEGFDFANAYDEVAKQDPRPGSLYAADNEAREVTERLIRDAGYDPVYAGDLKNARALEDFLGPLVAFSQASGGPVFYRFARP